MVTADLVRAAVVATVAILSLSGGLELWHLAVAGFIVGGGEAFFIPSYTALVPRLLPEEELLAANGLEGTLRPLAEFAAGPAIGGIAVAALSPGAAIMVDAGTFLVSAACLFGIRIQRNRRARAGDRWGRRRARRPARGRPLRAAAPPGCGRRCCSRSSRSCF